MTCLTEEQFNSAIEHHKAINDVRVGQDAETTVQFLRNTRSHVSKIAGFYQTPSSKVPISTSVTQKIGKKYQYSANVLLDQQALIGNLVHEASEFVINDILQVTSEMSNDAAFKYVKNLKQYNQEGLKKIYRKYGKTFSEEAAQNLFLGIQETMLSIYRQQALLNNLSKNPGKVTIFPEQVVINPKKDIGGTIDLLAIFSDNTAGIFDFKTKISKGRRINLIGEVIDEAIVIPKRDIDKYKLQTGEYGRILREAYGVKSIRNITILPIKINVDLNNAKKKYGDVIKNIRFPGQDPFLEKIIPFSNKTGLKSLDELIKKIDDQIITLEERIRRNYKLKDDLSERIANLEQSKKDILLNHSLDKIIDYGKSLAEKVKKAKLNDLDIVETQDLLNELKLLNNLASSTYEYRKTLEQQHPEKLQKFKEQIGEFTFELEEAIKIVEQNLYETKIANLIELHTGYKITDDMGNITPFAQEGYFGKLFYQLSQFENPVFQTLRKILNDVNYSTRVETDKIVEEIVQKENAVYSWLKNNGKSFDDLITIMVNPATDNFWSRYTKEFAKRLESLPDDQIHIYYDVSENYAESYKTRLELYKTKFKDLSKKEYDEKLKTWIEENDLTLVDNTPKYSKAWTLAKKYHRLHLKESPNNFNEQYKYIRSIPELKAYYEMFEKYNKHFRDMLGVEYSQLPNNFLPNIRKSMSERVSEQGYNGFISGTKDYLMSFSIREEDKSADGTYNNSNKIPIFFLNPFRNEDNSIQTGEKSYQFGRSLAIFAKMANEYRALNQREAEILALQEFLNTQAEQFLERRGQNVIDQMGNQLSEKLQANDLPEIFRTFVDMYVYKIGIQPVIGDKSGEAERLLLKAKEYFTLKTLGLNVIAGAGSFVSAKINAIIEGNKGIIYNTNDYKESVKDAWASREKFLAINAYFDPMSHRLNNPRIAGEEKYGERMYGDPTMRGWINKYVNSRMLMNTFSVGDQYIEEVVLVSMSKNYYVDESGNLKRFKSEQDRELNKDRSIWNLFSYDKESGAKLNLSEAHMMNAFESFRLAVQAGQSRIKGTIPEEDKAHWQTNIIMQIVMHFKSWMPGILFERFGKVKYDNRIDSLYMGKYTALSKEFANPDKLAFSTFFKKIVLPKVGKLVADISTFGLLSKNRLVDKNVKQHLFEKWLDENPHMRDKVSVDDFIEIQQKQLKSVIQELRVLLTLAGLILLLGADWDDDGEKDYKKYLLTRKLASLTFKVQQELSFTYSPVAFAGMVKSPIPMIGLVTDFWKTVSNTIDEILDPIFGEERLIGGTTNDKQPIFYNSHKWVPGLGGTIRFLDLFNDDVAYSNSNN